LASFQLSHRVFKPAPSLNPRQNTKKSSLRTATLFFKTLLAAGSRLDAHLARLDRDCQILLNTGLTFAPFNGKIFKRATISGKKLQR
jgi:hypothetical protein